MNAVWQADRMRLRALHRRCPDWSSLDLADATGRSRSWVNKWLARFRQAPPNDEQVLHGYSCARHTPPARLSPLVVERILDIRDHPPDNLKRTPGPKAILYYLSQEANTTLHGERVPRSTRAVWQILRQYQRIIPPHKRVHQPVERPEPFTSWQLDFKDASTVPADPEGKQQHVVEVLDAVDVGTSIVIAAEPRADFTMATAIETAAAIVSEHGLPQAITIDRDPRFVGESHQRESPSAFLRFWLCLGVEVKVCPPRRPDLNGFVERYHRSYDQECLRVERPTDLETVRSVTAAFREHYNRERPHQGQACGNQPPQHVFGEIRRGRAVPEVVDADGWLSELDGQRYVRKVQQDTSVSVGQGRYYVRHELCGQEVSLQIDAKEQSFVIRHGGKELKRVRIAGSGQGKMTFGAFVELLCAQARAARAARGVVSPTPRQRLLRL